MYRQGVLTSFAQTAFYLYYGPYVDGEVERFNSISFTLKKRPYHF